MTVLILARDLDSSADRMVEALGKRGVPVFRTDLAAFPQGLTLDARLGPQGWDGVLATPHREVRLSDIRSVWYRHQSHFVRPPRQRAPLATTHPNRPATTSAGIWSSATLIDALCASGAVDGSEMTT